MKIMLMRLFFTQLFVSERKQIAIMAEEKSPARISLRLFATNRSEMRIILKITIICVGKIKEKYLTDAIAEYTKRLSKYCKLDIIQLQDEKTIENASEAVNKQIKDKEGERILKNISDDSYVITLEINGEMISSEKMADKINSLGITGTSHITFIIGGSLGLSENVSKRSNYKLSFSKMTFPHQLMRVILLEQIYRSYRIINNEPYHK